MDKRKILTTVLSVSTMIVAVFAWLSVQRAITVSDASTWLQPIIFFSLYIILVCLDMVVFGDILFLELLLGATLLTSFVFAPHLYQFAVILLGAYFLFVASRKIRRELELNVKINIWRALQAGKAYLLISIIIVISMQYFLTVSKLDNQVGVPKFDLAPMVKKIALPAMAIFNPSLKNVNNESLTVDQFFRLTQQENLNSNQQSLDDQAIDSRLPQDIAPEERELLKQQIRDKYQQSQNELNQKTGDLMLQAFHEQLSEIAGYQISGNEKISDVYAGLIAEKMDKFLQYPVTVGNQKTSAYPIILTVVLILTIYPIGSLLSIAWFLIVWLAFVIFVRSGVVSINKVTVQKEIIG